MFDAFRIHLAGHPLLLTLAAFAVLWLARLAGGRFGARALSWTVLRAAFVGASLVALVVYAGMVVFYATDPHYFDAAEPTMTAVGWLFHVGQPISHTVDSPERYAHIYGPMAFIVHGVALGVFGPSIEVSKWVGGFLALASLPLMFLAMRSSTPARRAIVLTGVCALLFLAFRNYTFWTRAEPLLIFCVSAGLAIAALGRGAASAVAFGVIAGVLWNVKATGVVYSLPLFVLLQRRLGWSRAMLSLATAAVAAVLPFVALSNVSFTNYLAWFRLSARNGLMLSLFKRNLEWATFFLLPAAALSYMVGASRHERRSEWAAVAIALVASVAGVVVAGSKPGAGPYHLLPLLPVIGYLVAHRWGDAPLRSISGAAPLLLASFVITSLSIAAAMQFEFITIMRYRRALDEVADIRTFVNQHAGVVEMGYGSDDPLTFERPVLVFRNNSYLIDQPAVGEHELAGVPVPAATIDALRRCRVNFWLIPKGQAPFTARNMYPAVFQQPLFSDDFRRVFQETHVRAASTIYFDAWECRSAR